MENWSKEEKLELINSACKDFCVISECESFNLFKESFILFLQDFYQRLEYEELRLLKMGRYDLNSYLFSIGTDEFEIPYNDYYMFLRQKDTEGKTSIGEILFAYKDMFEALKRTLKEMGITIPPSEFFADLMSECLKRLGFTSFIDYGDDPSARASYSTFCGSSGYEIASIIRVDLASRLHVLDEEFCQKVFEIAKERARNNGGTMYFDYNHEKEYIFERLKNFHPESFEQPPSR